MDLVWVGGNLAFRCARLPLLLHLRLDMIPNAFWVALVRRCIYMAVVMAGTISSDGGDGAGV